MKKSMILFIAAAAAVMALVSCTKETPDNNGTKEEQNTGLRTLTVSFAPPTRTYLDGLQPKWKGDGTEKISLNGTEYTVPVEAAGQTSFTLTTAITGDIIAVYPADAWSSSEPHFTLANQKGTFAAANICMATAAATDTELTFYNQTAVIELNVPDGTTSLTVTSLNPIGTSGQRANSGAEAIADGSSPTTISISNNSLSSPWYVAVLPGALLRDLNFDVTYSEGKTAQGGFSPYYIASKKLNPDELTVAENSLYTLPANSLHEYITVDGKKWATQNVAVTASGKREFGGTGLVVGDYFQWASHAGYCGDASDADGGFLIYSAFTNMKCGDSADAFTFKSGVNLFGKKNSGAKVARSPYCDNITGNYDSKYSASTKTRLDLEDDAAFYFWGGAWRMPERGDFENLLNYTSTTNKSENFDTELGVLTIKGTSLRFPAASYGTGAGLGNAGSNVSYWSSSLHTNTPSSACYLTFKSTAVTVTTGSRYDGRSVRPVSVSN